MNHPILPAGYNSWDIDGDEVDSPGVNEPVWPDFLDSFEALPVIVMTDEMFDVFDGCADYVIPCWDDTIVFPATPDTVNIGKKAA